jgi:hypothetical protein
VDNSGAPVAGAWTARRVADELVAAYEAAQRSGSWARVREFADRIDDQADRRELLRWVSFRASGRSIRELCREINCHGSTYRARLNRTLARIADGLNRERVSC